MAQTVNTVFTADTSGLKKAMSEASTAIKTARKSFDAQVAGMDNWRKSSEGLQAKLKQLQQTEEAQKKQLETQKQTLKQLEQAQTSYKSKLDELKKKKQDLEQQGRKETEEYKRNQQAIKATEQALKANANQTSRTEQAISDIEIALTRTRNETGKWERALEELKQQEQETASETEDLADNADKAGNAVSGAGGIFTKAGTAITAGFVAVIGKAITTLVDFSKEYDKASKKLQAQLGATDADMKAWEASMEKMYANNFGENLDDIANKFSYVAQATKETDPETIRKLAENAITLEDTFGSDFEETIRGTNALITHFGLSADEAFDLIAKGSQKGLDYTHELGDNLSEYAGDFQQAGYSAEEMFQVLYNGTSSGAYNLDKINDSINEVKNRLGDGSIAENIDLFSTRTQGYFTAWTQGKGTMKDVVNSIISDIKTCKNEQEALTLASTAFGTMGEDANLKVVQSLTSTGETLKDTQGAMQELQDIRYDTTADSLEGVKRSFEMNVLSPLRNEISPVIEEAKTHISDFISSLTSEDIKKAVGIIGAVGAGLATWGVGSLIQMAVTAIGGFITTIQTAGGVMAWFNGICSANPIGLVVLAISALVAGFVALYTQCEPFKAFIDGLVQTVMSVIGQIPAFISQCLDGIVGFFTQFFNTIKTGWDALNFIINNFPYVLGYVIGLICKAIGEFWVWLVQKGTEINAKMEQFFADLMQWFVNLPGNIWQFLTQAVQKLSQWAVSVGEKAKQAGKALWDGFIDTMKHLPERVGKLAEDIVTGLWNGICGMGDWLWGKITGFCDDFVSGFKDALGIHSPSRVFADLASYIPEGIAVGIKANTAPAYKQMQALSQGLQANLQTVKSGLSLGIDSVNGQNQGGNIVYNFTQNNNSPKALDLKETYRQTKNILNFATMKGV